MQAVVGGFARGDLGPAARARRARARGWRAERTRRCRCWPPSSTRLLATTPSSRGRRPTRSGSAAGSSTTRSRCAVAASDALVFPSTFPEAFGMVAAEAAAAEALPVSAAHSGAAEVSRELADELEPGQRDLVSFELDAGRGRGDRRAARALARARPGGARRDRAPRCAATAERLWSWDGVARTVLAASAGRARRAPATGREPGQVTPATSGAIGDGHRRRDQ